MKTFVSDDYQITIKDNGGFDAQVFVGFHKVGLILYGARIKYDPDDETKPWAVRRISSTKGCFDHEDSQFISGLRLIKEELELLHEALEVTGKQDLMDNEIVFVDKKEK